MDQMRELKHEYAEEGRARSKQHSELVTELDAAREEIERLRMTGDHERMAWEQEVKRHEGLLNTSREKAANDAVDLQGQLKKAQSELQESRDQTPQVKGIQILLKIWDSPMRPMKGLVV